MNYGIRTVVNEFSTVAIAAVTSDIRAPGREAKDSLRHERENSVAIRPLKDGGLGRSATHTLPKTGFAGLLSV